MIAGAVIGCEHACRQRWRAEDGEPMPFLQLDIAKPPLWTSYPPASATRCNYAAHQLLSFTP